MLVGPSGYERWSTRALFQPSEQSSVVTIEAVLPRREGPQQVPGATPAAMTDGASATFSHEGLSWTRTLVQTPTGWTVRDALSLDDSHPDEGRTATWHWHLRGEVTSDDGAETLSWTLDDVDCELRISGTTSAWRVDSAAHSDDGTGGATHPVLRFEAVVRSEPTKLEAAFVCGRAR